jgi:protein SCO1/2
MQRRAFSRWLALGAGAALTGLLPNLTAAQTKHVEDAEARLPTLGAAPPFELTDQAGRPLALSALRGRVLALTFIYTHCADTCPILTARLVGLQTRLGTDFGSRVHFVSISLDPETDTPTVLLAYARAHGVALDGWSFLTGSREAVQAAARGFGSYAKRQRTGAINHLTLTSLVDRDGRVRVQYLGTRFRDDEMLRDLRALLAE